MTKQEVFDSYEKLIVSIPDDFMNYLKRKTIEEFKQNPEAFLTAEEKETAAKEHQEVIEQAVKLM